MAANTVFQPVTERGFWLGLSNLFAKENNRWWGKRRWWIQILLWTAILNGTLAFLLFAMPGLVAASGEVITRAEVIQTGIEAFFSMSVLAIAVGIIILAQDAIIQEKQSGTAEWVLSKPASRSAFLLAKLFANGLGILAVMVVLQAAVAYGQLTLFGAAPDLLPFLKGAAILAVNAFFYLTLTLMLGVILNARGAVLGIAMGLLFGGQLSLNFVPRLLYVTPFGFGNLAAGSASGMSLPPEMNLPIYASIAWGLLFTAVALWRINKMEV